MIEGLIYVVMIIVTAVILNLIMDHKDGSFLAKEMLPAQVCGGLLWPIVLPIIVICFAVHYIVQYIKS